jgi:hypothetical protein
MPGQLTAEGARFGRSWDCDGSFGALTGVQNGDLGSVYLPGPPTFPPRGMADRWWCSREGQPWLRTGLARGLLLWLDGSALAVTAVLLAMYYSEAGPSQSLGGLADAGVRLWTIWTATPWLEPFEAVTYVGFMLMISVPLWYGVLAPVARWLVSRRTRGESDIVLYDSDQSPNWDPPPDFGDEFVPAEPNEPKENAAKAAGGQEGDRDSAFEQNGRVPDGDSTARDE